MGLGSSQFLLLEGCSLPFEAALRLTEGMKRRGMEFGLESGEFLSIPSVERLLKTKTVDVLCVLSALVLGCEGDWDRKLELVFSVFDLEDSGSLSEAEMAILMMTCLRALATTLGRGRMPTDDDGRRWTSRAYEHLNKNSPDRFTSHDFLTFAKTSLGDNCDRAPDAVLVAFGLLDAPPSNEVLEGETSLCIPALEAAVDKKNNDPSPTCWSPTCWSPGFSSHCSFSTATAMSFDDLSEAPVPDASRADNAPAIRTNNEAAPPASSADLLIINEAPAPAAACW